MKRNGFAYLEMTFFVSMVVAFLIFLLSIVHSTHNEIIAREKIKADSLELLNAIDQFAVLEFLRTRCWSTAAWNSPTINELVSQNLIDARYLENQIYTPSVNITSNPNTHPSLAEVTFTLNLPERFNLGSAQFVSSHSGAVIVFSRGITKRSFVENITLDENMCEV